MTKNEQIDEMVSIMAASNNPFVDVPIEIMPKATEALYNAGYRKIDDECAVITKAELKQYKSQAVKEFAERVKMEFYYEFDEIIPSIMSGKIDELLKDYER